jgi:pantothenate kinase
MKLPPEIIVTDQKIDISSLTTRQNQYFEELARKIKLKYQNNGNGRQIFTLSGSAGSGKSVIASILNYIFKDDTGINFKNIGLDSFHYDNGTLDKLGLLPHEGRYDTYDTDLLLNKLNAFRNHETVKFPSYSRKYHNPIADQIEIKEENCLLFIEGQWLLRNKSPWLKIHELSNYNYLIKSSPGETKEGVINRHIAGGRSKIDAETFYLNNDLPNSKEVASATLPPDEVITFYKNI